MLVSVNLLLVKTDEPVDQKVRSEETKSGSEEGQREEQAARGKGRTIVKTCRSS